LFTMTGPIEPIRPIRLIGRNPKRPGAGDAQPEPTPVVNLTINVGPPNPGAARPMAAEPTADAETHMIAQAARTRGLRGGQKVLEAARSAYLEAQWSGPRDRRANRGRITKTTA
jgi:hypothetical protein